MARRKRLVLMPRPPRLEIVPMIDIMMFLLVFFIMITLRMIPDAGLSLVLPDAATATALPPNQVVIGVDASGRVYLHDAVVDLQALQSELITRRAERRLGVVIAADHGVELQDVMRVLDAVRRAGITDVGFATKQE